MAQGQPLPLEMVLNRVKTAFADQPDTKIESISPTGYHRLYQSEISPVEIWMVSKDDDYTAVYANPYSGAILSQHKWEGSFFDRVYHLHYELMAGQWGMYLVGVIGLLATILCVTGILLWPGWRKLSAGFKIKWNARPKRLNFDLHKVAGIVAAVFLMMATFTGFLWNFWDWSEPATYAVLLSEKPADSVSKPVVGQTALSVSQIIQQANAALPEGTIASVTVPAGTFEVRKQLPQDTNYWGEHSVYLDQYSGDVLRIDTTTTRSSASKLLNVESTVHYGTFWGTPSRLLYLFVGLSPTILLITGFVMWRLRKRGQSTQIDRPELVHPD